MLLDVALYSDRLLGWLYDKQVSQIKHRQAKDEVTKQYLRGQYPEASEYEVQQIFGAHYGPNFIRESESEQGYIGVGTFLKPLGLQSRAAYDIVNYAAEQDWLIASENEPLGRNLGGIPILPRTGEPSGESEYYDRVLITAEGIRVAEVNYRTWHDVMPQTSPLAQRLLIWLSGQEDSSCTPACLPNFLPSGHGCYMGRPMFTAAVLQEMARYLQTNGLLEDCTGGGPCDMVMVRLTKTGFECVVGFSGDVARYLTGALQVGGTNITVTGSTGVAIAHQSPGAKQAVTSDIKLDDLINFAGFVHQIASTLQLAGEQQAALEASAVELSAAARVSTPDKGYLRRIGDGIMKGLASAAPTFASQTAIELGERALRALGG